VLSAIASVLLVPPVNLALLALAGVLLGWRCPRLGRWLALVSLLLLVGLAMPVTAGLLMNSLQASMIVASAAPIPPEMQPEAIIILGGDVAGLAGDRRDDVGPLTLERLRAGAALARRTHLPLLVTGGVVNAEAPPVAVLMAQSLEQDFAMPARWVEPAARDTWENARRSATILRPAGITRVYVVTHAWHMRRALIAFRHSGLIAVAAPLAPGRTSSVTIGDFIPYVAAWRGSFYALHEWIGCAWYVLRQYAS
jgi:uncharacterized SAM-binding protein YcdF (DUF218 family)